MGAGGVVVLRVAGRSVIGRFLLLVSVGVSFGGCLPVAGGGGAAVGAGRRCPFFENCTVDASIFVVKLVRAHGGCLGTRSR